MSSLLNWKMIHVGFKGRETLRSFVPVSSLPRAISWFMPLAASAIETLSPLQPRRLTRWGWVSFLCAQRCTLLYSALALALETPHFLSGQESCSEGVVWVVFSALLRKSTLFRGSLFSYCAHDEYFQVWIGQLEKCLLPIISDLSFRVDSLFMRL